MTMRSLDLILVVMVAKNLNANNDVPAFKKNDGNGDVVKFDVGGGTDELLNRKID